VIIVCTFIIFLLSTGGPVRYLASKGLSVLAIEIQADLSQAALQLTQRCECDISNRITHINSNFNTFASHLRPSHYDAVTSWLTILHMSESERMTCFQHSYDLLKVNGAFYTEDFYSRRTLSQTTVTLLKRQVFCRYLPDLETYTKQLSNAKLHVTDCEDLTEHWTQVTQQRADIWRTGETKQVKIHGTEIYQRLLMFYDTIAALFKSGEVGGVRIIAKKTS